jgi:beta-phosphoglucomutase
MSVSAKDQVKAVIFDMDGVLTNTVEYHYLSWKKAVEPYGISFSPQENEKLLGLTRRRSLEVILGDQDLPETEIERILRQKNDCYLEYVARMTPSDLLPGAARLLAELRRSGLKVAVASSSRNTHPVLHSLGIFPLVDAVSDGAQVQRSKPFPDIFLHAALSLRVSPVNCLAVEDSAPGIRAALDAGMFVIGLGPLERVSQAHVVYPDLVHVYLEDLLDSYQSIDLYS